MSKKTSRSSSVDRALTLLDCFTEKNFYLSLNEITQKSGIPRSTVFRMLTSLETFGYIKNVKVSGKTLYSLGHAFLEKGMLVHRHIDIREYARDYLIELRNELNLTVQLAIRDGLDALYIEQIPSFRSIQLYPAIGRKAPLYSAACPRVLLAFTKDKEREYLLNQYNFRSFTPNTPVELADITKRLKCIRKEKYSISKGELFEGTIAIAVPIFCPHTNEVLAALSVIGLERDFENVIDSYISILQRTAFNISKEMER